MLPGTLLRQIYADNPPCGEMRNTKHDGMTHPDFRSYGNIVSGFLHARILRFLATRNLYHKISSCRYAELTVPDFM